jgi:ribosomal protein S18 acetylase RimI-like enzyme
MKSDRKANAWVDVRPGSLDAAVEVLALAFDNDPLMKYVFSGAEAYGRGLREVFRFVCEARFDLDWPILGTYTDNHLCGVACLSPPEDKTWPPSLGRKYDRLQASVGYEAFNRLGRFSRLSRKHAPAYPHFYLAAIGIRPEFQGRGLGRVLLNGVAEMSASHPDSDGVFLETAQPGNVALYERFGYRVIARDKLDDAVDFWYMFRGADGR